MKKLIIIGAGGHGKVVADIASRSGYSDISFLDDNDMLKYCMRYPVIGNMSDIGKYKECAYIVAVGNLRAKENIQEELKREQIDVVTLIHPDAVIADSATIGVGTVIMAGAVVNPDSVIGCGCIINTGASIDHDNVIGDYVHVSVGAHLAGTVHVGNGTCVGAGAVISNNVNICDNCVIGAGAVVVKDIEEPGVYIGVPAKKR